MTQKDYDRQGRSHDFQNSQLIFSCSVVDTLRLAEGTLFPMPITLDVTKEDIDRL